MGQWPNIWDYGIFPHDLIDPSKYFHCCQKYLNVYVAFLKSIILKSSVALPHHIDAALNPGRKHDIRPRHLSSGFL
jgi:hypothetical protein